MDQTFAELLFSRHRLGAEVISSIDRRLTQCGLATPHGTKVGQLWFLRHQAIIYTNYGVSSVRPLNPSD